MFAVYFLEKKKFNMADKILKNPRVSTVYLVFAFQGRVVSRTFWKRRSDVAIVGLFWCLAEGTIFYTFQFLLISAKFLIKCFFVIAKQQGYPSGKLIAGLNYSAVFRNHLIE